MRSEAFGRLLKAAIGSIVAHAGATAPAIEDALGDEIGVSAASIQRYKAGHIPPDPRAVELLATAGVRRGFLNRDWLAAFLQAARHPDAAALLDRLYPSSAAPALPPDRVYDNLPAPTYARFVPRPDAYADVLDGLRQRAALVLLVGLGGVGKTSLAHEIAVACRDGTHGVPSFGAVIWLSDQDHPGATTLATALYETARALDYPRLLRLELAELRRAVDDLLRRQRVLLVVDGCETIADAALLAWLTRLPEPSKVLATSRIYRTELLRSCWPVELHGLAPAEARALLDHKLSALKLSSRARDAARIEALLGATGGNPKAIEIAAGYLKYGGKTLGQVVEDLAAARGELFDDLFARCWGLLGEPGRQVLLALALFAGSASHAGLAATAGLGAPAAGDALARLRALALADTIAGDLDAPRYALHPLVRAFAAVQLRERPDFERAARERQLAWFADLAGAVGYCWDDLDRLKLLDPERETLTALVRWGLEHAQGAGLARLLAGVDYYYFIRGLWSADLDISAARAVVARHAGSPAEALRALAYHVQMLCRQGQLAAAERELPRLLDLSAGQTLADDLEFEVKYTQALYAMASGDDDAAIAIWEALLPLARAISVRAYAVNRGWLAICHYRRGAVEQARALWSDTLRDAAAGGFARGVISSQVGLACVHLDEGHGSAARALLEPARAAAQSYHDRGALAEIDALMARYHEQRGEPDAALRYRAAAEETIARVGIARGLWAHTFSTPPPAHPSARGGGK